MAYIKSIIVFLITLYLQNDLGKYENWNLTSVDYYIFFGTSFVMAVITYIFGLVEDLIYLKYEYNNDTTGRKE